jgi:hypothetical protein
LATSIGFKVMNVGDKVVNYGDVGDNFYIILLGVVSIMIPNPTIVDWKCQRKKFERLLDWKKVHFDPKFEKAKEDMLYK